MLRFRCVHRWVRRVRAGAAMIMLTVSASSSCATVLNWYSPAGAANFTSTGAPMDAAFTFDLGVFTAGFTPLSTNIGTWSAAWRSVGTAPYNASTKSFDANFTVTGNAAPFTAGAPAWIWGKRTTATSTDWILVRHPSWSWPTPNPFSPFPTAWDISTATLHALGTVTPGGNPILLRSDNVLSYDQWKVAALASTSLKAPVDDPDMDGASNLVEFALGSNPASAASRPGLVPTFPAPMGPAALQLTVPRASARLVLTTVEVSPDLLTWLSGPAHVSLVSSTPSSWLYQDNTLPSATSPRHYIRLRLALP